MAAGSAELVTAAGHETPPERARRQRRALVLGTGVSVAVVAGIALAPSTALHVLLGAALAATWAALMRWAGSSLADDPAPVVLDAPAPKPRAARSEASVAPELPLAASTRANPDVNAILAASFGTCGATMADASESVLRSQRLLEESVQGLLEAFDGLKQEAQAQSTLAMGLVHQFAKSQEGKGGVLDRFISETDSAMRDFVDHIVVVSKQSMAMASRVQDITAQMDEIEAVTVQARKLAGNTSMLALNAKVEAAKAGAQASGFKVIADEVQALARESQDFNTTISGLVQAMRQTIVDTESAIQALASQDMNRAVEARTRADSLAQEVENINAEMRRNLESVSDGASRVDRDVSAAVRVLQFEDIVRQVLNHAVELLGEGGRLTTAIEQDLRHGADESAFVDNVQRLLDAHRSTVHDVHQAAEQDSLHQGEIELF